MTDKNIIDWLLEGDVSIRYQTCRDILHDENPKLRKKIESEGWGAHFLKLRQSNGHWGGGFYLPKWTSSHYTLLELKNLNIAPKNKMIHETLDLIFAHEKGPDGGLNPSKSLKNSDVCINGMALNYACYFGIKQEQLISLVDFLLTQIMPDGGFNCHSNRKGALHSSLHTTLSILEGILEYKRNGYKHRLNELEMVQQSSEEFILMHRLFRSDKTGEIISPDFLKLYYPGRWYYDVLKALDYFQSANVHYDARMDDALKIIVEKRNEEGLWKLPSHHNGKLHFETEKAGKPSRWNTLRALRVLNHYGSH